MLADDQCFSLYACEQLLGKRNKGIEEMVWPGSEGAIPTGQPRQWMGVF
jgi:hypothetical protein